MKRTDYINWDEYFMGIALLTAMRSKDPSSQVGACIVSPENKILSLGYNGMPIGCDDDAMPWDREGDPLEIYTEKDGEVIFKKYSPMGDLGEFAGQICEAIGKNTGYIAAVCDRDAIIAVHGVQKRELLDKRCSQELEQLMELRRSYRYQDGDLPVRPTDASDRYRVGAAAPIVTEGDLMGCVLLLSEDGAPALGEAEQRLVQTVAGFLGRQMES